MNQNKSYTRPSRLAVAGVSGIEADTGGVVKTRIGEAVVDNELCGRHAAAEVAGGHSIVQDTLAGADVRRAGLARAHSARAQEARRPTALRLEVAARTWKTRLQAAAGHVTLATHRCQSRPTTAC